MVCVCLGVPNVQHQMPLLTVEFSLQIEIRKNWVTLLFWYVALGSHSMQRIVYVRLICTSV